MTIEEAQKTVDNWIKTYGVRYFNELTNMAILTEEVGEVARIIARKYGEQSFKKGENGEKLADEMADVLWVLICLANQTGIDLTDAFQKNILKKNTTRRKTAYQQRKTILNMNPYNEVLSKYNTNLNDEKVAAATEKIIREKFRSQQLPGGLQNHPGVYRPDQSADRRQRQKHRRPDQTGKRF